MIEGSRHFYRDIRVGEPRPNGNVLGYALMVQAALDLYQPDELVRKKLGEKRFSDSVRLRKGEPVFADPTPDEILGDEVTRRIRERRVSALDRVTQRRDLAYRFVNVVRNQTKTLSGVEQQVLNSYFNLDGNGRRQTASKIGKVRKISPENVRQLIRDGKRKLKEEKRSRLILEFLDSV